MADTRISLLNAGGDALATDAFAVARSSTNVQVLSSGIKEYVLGDYDSSFRLLSLERVITSAEILALNSSSVELLAAEAGVSFIARAALYYHIAGGTAYTLSGVTAIQIRNATTANGPGFAGTSFLDSNAEESIMMLGPGNGTNLFSGVDIQAAAGQNLNLYAAGANPAVGTFDVNLRLLYQRIVMVP